MLNICLLLLVVYKTVDSEVFLQQTSPSYHPVCPGDNVTITCNVSTGSTALTWRNPPNPSVAFTGSIAIGTTEVVGIFTVKLIGKNIPNFELSSEVSVQNIQLNNNGSSLSCSDQTLGGNMEAILILISGVPSSPSNVSFTADTITHLTLYWSPPTENINCIVKYIVKINDQQMETTVTSLSVPNLFIGSVYNVTVYSQDSANRNGSISELLRVTWKVPLPVSALSWNISEIDGDTSIILIWEHDEDSSRPSTQHFFVSHNISEPWNTTTMNSSIILTGIKRGNTYVINVSAVNILGESLPEEIEAIINEVSTTTTQISSTTSTTIITSSTFVLSSMFQETNTTPQSFSDIYTSKNSVSTITSSDTIITLSNTICLTDTLETCSNNIQAGVVIGATLGIVISTIVSVIVTSLVCLLITQKRIQQHKTLPDHKLQDPVIKTGPVYDVPDMNIKPVQNTFELQTNTAYGRVN